MLRHTFFVADEIELQTIGANKAGDAAAFDINFHESETKSTGRIVLKDGYYDPGVAYRYLLPMRVRLNNLHAVDVVYYNIKHLAGFYLKHVYNHAALHDKSLSFF